MMGSHELTNLLDTAESGYITRWRYTLDSTNT